MSKLDKMRDRLNKLDDPELLEVARELLSEMADVHRLKEQIELREQKFSEGKRAAFYFFAQSLDAEELMHACNTATGRIRVLKEKQERAERLARINGEITEDEEKEVIEDGSVSVPKPSFGGLGGLGSSFDSK